MKRNINNSNLFKSIIVMLFVLVVTSVTLAQTRPPQNIRRVTVANQYAIENGKPTEKFWAIHQELYDSLGRLHTEIDLDSPDHYPHNYIWNTFSGTQKVKSDFFKNEKLEKIEEYGYDKEDQLIIQTIKQITKNDTSLYLILNFKYDVNKNKVEVLAKTANGKTGYLSKSTYNDKGKELTRKVKLNKNIFPQDSILQLVTIPKYDSIGRLVSEQQTINKVGKKNIQKHFAYSYDKNNNLIGLIEFDIDGKQIRREERVYNYSRNRLSLIKFYDGNNVLYKMIEKRYEIYRTEINRIREIDY